MEILEITEMDLDEKMIHDIKAVPLNLEKDKDHTKKRNMNLG